MALCKCGCGREVKQTYVSGHNSRGHHHSEETKRKISLAHRGLPSKLKGRHGYRIFTEETRRRMSISAKNKPPMTEEHRKRIGARMLGRHHSLETRIKMSKSGLGKSHKSPPPFTEEHKQKMRDAWKMRRLIPMPDELRKRISAKLTGRRHTEETRLKMKGKIRTPEMLKRMSEVQLGRKHTEEDLRKMRLVQVGHPGYMKGKHQSDEAKRKISLAKKGIKISAEAREHMRLAFRHRNSAFFNTSIEKLVQNELSSREYAYYPHYPIVGRPDIAFPDQKVLIFCDGDYWHNLPGRQEKDLGINKELQAEGWLVLRYWEHEINANPVAVVDEIEDVLFSRMNAEKINVG